jgi:DNA-binding response OmpR family regulator
MNVLLVEDDPAIGRALVRGLSGEGYSVNWRRAADGTQQALSAGCFNLAILDLGLPDGDGVDLCAALRDQGLTTPILMLTARATLQDKLDGFGAGADDYLTKPFAFEELLARMHALARRGDRERGDMIAVGAMRIDVTARIVTVDGTPLETSRREFDLLLCLARAGGHVLSRDQILSRVWGDHGDLTQNTVDVYVGYLRQLLAPCSQAPSIVTVRGIGYRLSA